MEAMRPPPPRGVALVLAAGILTLLAVLAAGFGAAARFAGDSISARIGARQAGLAAASGMDYAAARLVREGYPSYAASLQNRGDDWTAREPRGTPLEAMRNPSYSHGEPWRDSQNLPFDGLDNDGDGEIDEPGEGIGLYNGSESWLDLDGDGRFTAWSGRLRGGDLPFPTFSLRIEADGGKIPLNAGHLDVPFHDDATIPFHRGLTHALNNLGALLLPSGHPRLRQIATSGQPIAYSFFGDDILSVRPPGGFRDERGLAAALSGLGGGSWYPPDASGLPAGLKESLPYLDLGTPTASPQFGPPAAADDTLTPRAAVELAVAPQVVIESLWRYLGGPPDLTGWEPGAFPTLDPRTGNAVAYGSGRVLLFPDEARDLAKAVVAQRNAQMPHLSWNAFYGQILANASLLFPNAIDPSAYPVAASRRSQAKADLAFLSMTPDPSPFLGGDDHPFTDAPLGWASWGTPRNDGTGNARPLPFQMRWRDIDRVRLDGAPEDPFKLPGDALAPLGLSMHPPLRFDVAARGAAGPGGAASAGGRFQSADLLFLGSQEDFENLSGAPSLGFIGLEATNDNAWSGYPADSRRRGIEREDSALPVDPDTNREYRRAASLPRWDFLSYPAGVTPDPSGYSRFYGALGLAAREGGLLGAALYWPLGDSTLTNTQEFLSESALLPPLVLPWKGRQNINNPQLFPLDPSGPSTNPHITPYGVSARGASAPPLFIEESMNPPDGCPGCPIDTQIQHLTLEGWFHHVVPSKLQVDLFKFTSYRIEGNQLAARGQVTLSIAPPDGPNPDSSVRLSGRWPDQAPWPPQNAPQISSIDATVSSTGPHHFRITFQATGASSTDISLEIDGALVRTVAAGPMFGQHHETILILGCDDVRIYSSPPSESAQKVFERGRFVRRGTYQSPLYVCASPATLGFCQWTGIIPHGWPQAGPIAAKVIPYANPDGTGAYPDIPLGASGAANPLDTGIVRSFRYVVELSAPPAVPDPVLDTPIFESIWFTLQRKGRTPEWSAWEVK